MVQPDAGHPDAGRSDVGRTVTRNSDISRLRRRADFVRVAVKGVKVVRPGVIVQACRTVGDPGSGEAETRLGLTVSRKVGNAVERNRAKRRLRAAAAAMFPENAKAGYDYVLIGRRSTLTRPFSRLRDDLRIALRQIGTNGGKPQPIPERGQQRRPSS